jgi:hypothetical protein
MWDLLTTQIHFSESCSLLSATISSYFSLQLRGFLQSKHMAVAGISHMTDDLLGKIFYHLCEPGPLSLRHLFFVSRRFYYAAVNNAHLWTTISFDSLFSHYFHQWPGQGNRFVEQCLLRSGPFPLCLYIDYSDYNAYNLTCLLHPLETFGKPKWRGFSRCTSLLWDNGYQGGTIIQDIVALFPKSLPALQYISLSRFRWITISKLSCARESRIVVSSTTLSSILGDKLSTCYYTLLWE